MCAGSLTCRRHLHRRPIHPHQHERHGQDRGIDDQLHRGRLVGVADQGIQRLAGRLASDNSQAESQTTLSIAVSQLAFSRNAAACAAIPAASSAISTVVTANSFRAGMRPGRHRSARDQRAQHEPEHRRAPRSRGILAARTMP